MSKEVEAPAVVHSNSKGEQEKWFMQTCADVARSGRSVKNGKGSRPRTNTNSKAYQDNYDDIFRKKE